MRIVSQSRDHDFPYERCTLWIVNDNRIIASPIAKPETEVIMATYSSREKIDYVMHILHKIYSGNTIEDDEYSMFIESGRVDINMFSGAIPKSENLVFKFPHEDEINLSDNNK